MALIAGLTGPFIAMLRTPKIGPMSFSRFTLTYLLPVAPAVVAWDGVVSSLRSYTVAELREMASSVGSDDYEWEAGQVSYPTSFAHFSFTYLIGVPTQV